MLTLDFEQFAGPPLTRRIVLSGLPGGDGDIRYEFPDFHDLPEPAVLDGFMLAALFPAMTSGLPLRVNGPLSVRALRNARLFQEAWAKMRGHQCRVADITAERLVEDCPRASEGGVAAFSGGMDATFLMLRQAKAPPPRYNVRAGVLLDIVNTDKNQGGEFEHLRKRVCPLLENLGVEPIAVRYRRGVNSSQNWHFTYATEIASVLHNFSHRFDHGLLASTEPYDHLVLPLGSSPAFDYLLSGSAMEIVHDGAGFSRTEKAAAVARDPLALRTLQVCWQGPDKGTNCGVCLKCVLTRLNFHAVGAGDVPTFPGPFKPEMLDNFSPHSDAVAVEFAHLAEYARTHQPDASWLPKLERKLADYRAHAHRQNRPPLPFRALRRARRVLTRGMNRTNLGASD